MKTNFLKTILFIATTVVLISCDKDFNNIGGDIIGDEHYGMNKYSQDSLTVNAYTKTTGVVDSKNLDINPLGIYVNPVFGTTVANFATQVQLASVAPTIDLALNQTITNVVLYIPYFSRNTGTNPNGAYTYELDSIINRGNITDKIKLSVYENGYDMSGNDTDTEFLEGRRFYTNQNSTFDLLKVGSRLNDDNTDPNLPQNDKFFFSKDEHKVVFTPATGGTATTTYVAPGMRLNLNKIYFKNLLFSTASGTTTVNLTTNTVFMSKLKGLYFKTEQAIGNGCMSILDFKKATITVNYTEKTSSTDAKLVDKSIVINLSGNTASLLEHNPATGTHGTITNGDSTNGDEKLTIKGGEGSVAYIDLFGKKDVKKWDATLNKVVPGQNGISDHLDYLRHPLDGKKLLINEANLVFYIDKTNMGTDALEPNRLFLYDVRNKRPVIDYYYDGTSSSYPNTGKVVHDGIRYPKPVAATTTTAIRGEKYRIRITDHIRNIINKDSTNVTLGVSVCQSINNQYFVRQKTLPTTYQSWMSLYSYNLRNPYYYPSSSVMNPLGTILFGTKGTVPVNKRLQLEIWYTKAN